jgi:DNA-binding GntR family transcriptional regulator
MSASARSSVAAQPRGPAELRLLLELRALRRLAERGFSAEELAMSRQLASATMRPALRGDAAGYRQAERIFHLYLFELTADCAASEVARLLLSLDVGRGPAGQELGRRMVAGASEHREIVDLLADHMVSAAGDLLRHHVVQHWAVRPGPVDALPGRNPSAASGNWTVG